MYIPNYNKETFQAERMFSPLAYEQKFRNHDSKIAETPTL